MGRKKVNNVLLSGSCVVELSCAVLFWEPRHLHGSLSILTGGRQKKSYCFWRFETWTASGVAAAKWWIKHNVSCLTIPSALVKPWACWALANHHTDGINWNGNIIKNPINHGAVVDRRNVKTADWPSKMEFVLRSKRIDIYTCLAFQINWRYVIFARGGGGGTWKQ